MGEERSRKVRLRISRVSGAVLDELLDFFTVLLLELCTVHAVVVLEDGHAYGLAVLGCLFSGLHARGQGVGLLLRFR